MANVWHIILFSLIGGVFSLVGGLVLISNKRFAEKLVWLATPFAAGALLAAAFFDLLPEAAEIGNVESALAWTLLGLVIFFVLERFIHSFHHEHEAEDSGLHHTAPLIITSDTIHNAIDGVAIGAAFLVSVPTGIVTTLAVAAHEIPQEIGDFGLLLRGGFSRKKVVVVNIFSALATLPPALIVFWLGGAEAFPLTALLGLTAGFFIYIAVADLIPRIHSGAKQNSAKTETVVMILGILIIATLTTLAHDYIEAENSHGHDEIEERRIEDEAFGG
jgi:zinc and cadmium transporter